MSHDHHFLARLERLERDHAEIALGLYYDSPLVRHLLKVADVPEAAERVALCLGEPEAGPHLIVARDGGFVTALGEGMVLQAEQPVISRHRIDQISESVESLRSLVADAEAGGRAQTRRKLEAIHRVGPGLSQAQFDDLARWLPLLTVDFVKAHIEQVELCRRMFEEFTRWKGRVRRGKLNRRRRELLHEYWRSAWAVAHLTGLLGSDGGATLRDFLGPFEDEQAGTAMAMCWSLMRLGVSSFGLRGVWAASKMPGLIVPFAKRRYLGDEVSYMTTLTDGLCLAAAGLRHRRYRAEVGKVFSRALGSGPGDAGHERALIVALRQLCASYWDTLAGDPSVYRDHSVELGRRFVVGLYEGVEGVTREGVEELPEAACVAMFMHSPVPVRDPEIGARSLFERLAWIVEIEARDFYLPEALMAWPRRPWEPAESLALLEGREEGGVHRQQPVVREAKIGRNAPCPCGSGQKYKRCCRLKQLAS